EEVAFGTGHYLIARYMVFFISNAQVRRERTNMGSVDCPDCGGAFYIWIGK
ncbi:hypothetical protein KI387_039329, partial [Taxus chinensis]